MVPVEVLMPRVKYQEKKMFAATLLVDKHGEGFIFYGCRKRFKNKTQSEGTV